MPAKTILALSRPPLGRRSGHVDPELPDEPQEIASLETKCSRSTRPVTTVGEERMRQELPPKLSNGIVIPESRCLAR